MSTTEASRLLGVDRRTVIKWCEAGDLQAVRIGEGGHWRLIRSGVERIIRDQPVMKDREHRPFDDFRPSSTPERKGGEAA
jgi:excisionase family DNA binding protein